MEKGQVSFFLKSYPQKTTFWRAKTLESVRAKTHYTPWFPAEIMTCSIKIEKTHKKSPKKRAFFSSKTHKKAPSDSGDPGGFFIYRLQKKPLVVFFFFFLSFVLHFFWSSFRRSHFLFFCFFLFLLFLFFLQIENGFCSCSFFFGNSRHQFFSWCFLKFVS